MSTAISFSGVNYSVPSRLETNWASLSDYLIALSTGTFQRVGGTFTLTADANFGPSFGLVASYVKSRTADIALSGVIRLANNEGLGFRNAANNADIIVKINASNELEVDGAVIPTSTQVAASIATLQADINTRATSAALTGHTGASTGVHGVAGAVVGTTDAQVVTNKDIDGGTASNTSRITVPKATYANLLLLTRKEGTLLYATDLDTFFADDGTNLSAVGSGSGSGSGEINAIANPSAATATTGWTGVTRVTSGSPLDPVIATAFSISNAATTESSTSGGYYPIASLAPALRDMKLNVQFPFTTPATDVYRVSVYIGTTRVSLSTDSSGVTTLPAGVTGGTFTASFDSTTAAGYTLSITRTSGATGACVVTNVFVGPGPVGQSAASGFYEAVSTYVVGGSTSAPTFGTGTTYFRNTYRRGKYAEIRFELSQSALTSAANGSGDYLFPLPTGLEIDYAEAGKLAAATNLGHVGEGSFSASVAGARSVRAVILNTGAYVNKIVLLLDNDTATSSTFGSAVGGPAANTAIQISFTVKVPIVGWDESLNVGPSAQVEYISSPFTGLALSRSPNGSVLPSTTPAGTVETINLGALPWQYPPQIGDRITFEVKVGPTGNWGPMPNPYIEELRFDGTNNIGFGGGYEVAAAAWVIHRGKYRGGTNTAWSAMSGTLESYYRLVKERPGRPSGFSKANSLESGLVNPRKGQYGLTATSTAAGWSTIRAQAIYYQDQDGNHRLKFNVSGSIASKTLTTDTLTLAGVVFKNVTNFEQAVTGFNNGSIPSMYASTVINTANVQYGAASSTSTTRLNFSGDVELESRPSWA